MVFSLLPTVVFASETETSTTVYDWDQNNAWYTSTTDGNEAQPIKYNANAPDDSLPETLKTLYNSIYTAKTEAAKKKRFKQQKLLVRFRKTLRIGWSGSSMYTQVTNWPTGSVCKAAHLRPH